MYVTDFGGRGSSRSPLLRRRKKSGVKECNARQNNLLLELSSWCLQDLGTKVNRKKIETLVTIHVHQKDVSDSASVSEVF